MKKFEGLLFCTDLDGTLFTTEKTVSERNLEAIEYFKSEGGLFTFITGRMPMTSEFVCNIVKPNAPFGCVNGGGIYDFANKKYLWTATLSKDIMEIIDFVDKTLPDVGIQINTEEHIYCNKDNPAMLRFRKVTGTPREVCDCKNLEENILKILFAIDEEDRMQSLIKALREHPQAVKYDFIRSERRLYEILPKGVSKGNALIKMADLSGISKEKTISIGDYHNDISMIKSAKLGVAVANAIDDLKRAADYVTVSNNDDAIATIIDMLDKRIFNL